MKLDMKRMMIVLLLAALCGTLGAAPAEALRFSVDLVPGEHYSHRKWFGIIPVKLTPQIAVWIESADGRFVDTIYSTKSNGENSWRGADERPEALPLYNERRGTVDAYSSATPKKQDLIQMERSLAPGPGDYVVYAEVNSSFDYNESYPESRDNVDGQPALVYRGEFSLGAGGESARIDLSPVPAAGLTTALSIMESISLKVENE